ncbi:MAG TPA: PQQ-binding-like beta-propeller repeat protein [Streptosporangiaceae bacterium]|nr:PQQ-binding-like beta-propeller repeat protein [Streptosporangiaceae bacterium]
MRALIRVGSLALVVFVTVTAFVLPASAARHGAEAASAPSGAVISLSASKGTVGTTIWVRGSGFAGGERVAIYFSKVWQVAAVARKTGRFGPVRLTIPVWARPATHRISARGKKSGRSASASFTVPPDYQNWPQSRFDANQDGDNVRENVLSRADVHLLHKDWAFTATATVVSNPVVAAGLAYFSTSDFHIDTANAASGVPGWNLDFYNQRYSTAAVANGTVFLGSTAQEKLFAFGTAAGQQKWMFQTNANVGAAPTVADGVIYAASDQLYAVNADTGEKIWNFPAASTFSSPAVSNGIVYVGSSDGNVYAVAAASGLKVWKFTTQGRVFSSPAVSGGTVYVGSNDGNIYALDATSGQEKWHFDIGDFVLSSPAVAGGVVYVGGLDHKLYALNAISGHKIWAFTTDASIPDSPAVANGVVYVGAGHTVYALSAATGAKLWSFTAASTGASSPAIADGRLYIAFGPTLYAFGLSGRSVADGRP